MRQDEREGQRWKGIERERERENKKHVESEGEIKNEHVKSERDVRPRDIVRCKKTLSFDPKTTLLTNCNLT